MAQIAIPVAVAALDALLKVGFSILTDKVSNLSSDTNPKTDRPLTITERNTIEGIIQTMDGYNLVLNITRTVPGVPNTLSAMDAFLEGYSAWFRAANDAAKPLLSSLDVILLQGRNAMAETYDGGSIGATITQESVNDNIGDTGYKTATDSVVAAINRVDSKTQHWIRDVLDIREAETLGMSKGEEVILESLRATVFDTIFKISGVGTASANNGAFDSNREFSQYDDGTEAIDTTTEFIQQMVLTAPLNQDWNLPLAGTFDVDGTPMNRRWDIRAAGEPLDQSLSKAAVPASAGSPYILRVTPRKTVGGNLVTAGWGSGGPTWKCRTRWRVRNSNGFGIMLLVNLLDWDSGTQTFVDSGNIVSYTFRNGGTGQGVQTIDLPLHGVTKDLYRELQFTPILLGATGAVPANGDAVIFNEETTVYGVYEAGYLSDGAKPVSYSRAVVPAGEFSLRSFVRGSVCTDAWYNILGTQPRGSEQFPTSMAALWCIKTEQSHLGLIYGMFDNADKKQVAEIIAGLQAVINNNLSPNAFAPVLTVYDIINPCDWIYDDSMLFGRITSDGRELITKSIVIALSSLSEALTDRKSMSTHFSNNLA